MAGKRLIQWLNNNKMKLRFVVRTYEVYCRIYNAILSMTGPLDVSTLGVILVMAAILYVLLISLKRRGQRQIRTRLRQVQSEVEGEKESNHSRFEEDAGADTSDIDIDATNTASDLLDDIVTETLKDLRKRLNHCAIKSDKDKDGDQNVLQISHSMVDKKVAEATEELRQQLSKVNIELNQLQQHQKQQQQEQHQQLQQQQQQQQEKEHPTLRNKSNNYQFSHQRTKISNVWANPATTTGRRRARSKQNEATEDSSESFVNIPPWSMVLETIGKVEKDCSTLLKKHQIKNARTIITEDDLQTRSSNNKLQSQKWLLGLMTSTSARKTDIGDGNAGKAEASVTTKASEDHKENSKCSLNRPTWSRSSSACTATPHANTLAMKKNTETVGHNDAVIDAREGQQRSQDYQSTAFRQQIYGEGMISTLLDDYLSLISCYKMDSGGRLVLQKHHKNEDEGVRKAFYIKSHS